MADGPADPPARAADAIAGTPLAAPADLLDPRKPPPYPPKAV
jgi:hypothetical protein